MARRSVMEDMFDKPPEPEWICGTEAGRILGGVDVRTVKRLARDGLIGVRRIPSVRARYLREHVLELYRASLTDRTTALAKVAEPVKPAKVAEPKLAG